MPTLDASTYNDGGVNTTSSFSHTVTGSNTYLVEYIVVGTGSGSSTEDVSGVTYNSISMSALASDDGANSRIGLRLLGLVAPATGSNTVAVTMAGEVDHASMAVSYTGVNQSTPIGTAAAANDSDDTATSTISSAIGELVSAGMGMTSITSGSGNDTVVIALTDYSFNDFIATQEKAGETTAVLTWTANETGPWATCGVPMKPAAAGEEFLGRQYPQGVMRGVMRGAA